MEHETKRFSVAASDDGRDVSTQEKGDLIACHSHQLPASEIPLSAQEDATARLTMESTPKKWVLQTMSPRLEPATDLRRMLSPTNSSPFSLDRNWTPDRSDDSFRFDSISVSRLQSTVVVSAHQKEGSSRDVVVQARQVAVSEEDCSSTTEDWQPSVPSSPGSTGSHRGFYSFVEDPASPEAELNEAWMVSPERQAMLATLKEEDSFTLQTYTSGTKPGSLFEEDEDSRYHVNTYNGAQSKAEEEEKILREEIIHGQAPKKAAFREQWGVLETMDLSKSPKRLLEGLSLCYSPKTIKSEPAFVAEEGAVDNNQINFSAAREQFLKMERSRLNSVLQNPSSPKPHGRLWQSEDSLLSPRSNNEKYHSFQWLNRGPNQEKPHDEEEFHAGRKVTVCLTEDSVLDDLDSALEDVSGNPSVGSTSNDNPQQDDEDTKLASGYKETPIEREIRIAQEREESLRRLRGIKHSDVQEMVEIKTKSLLSQPIPLQTASKTKEKNRVSFLIQREIEKDSQREEDLLHQGKVPGLYDRGTPQELEEKKKIFELPYHSGAEEEKRKRDGSLPDATVRITSSSTEDFPFCCPQQHSEQRDLQTGFMSSTPSLNTTSEGCDSESQEPTRVLSSNFPKEDITTKGHETTEAASSHVTVKNTSSSKTVNDQSWILGRKEILPARRSSAKEAYSPSSVLAPSSPTPMASSFQGSETSDDHIPTWRVKLDSGGLRPRRQNAPDLIQKEIELDLKREQELRELRESSGLSMSMEGNLDHVGQDTTDTYQSPSLQRVIVEEEQPVFESPSLPIAKTRFARWSYSSITPASMLDKPDSPSPFSPSIRPPGRLPSFSMVTAQPWGSPRPSSPVVSRVGPLLPAGPWAEMSGSPGTPTQKGLTETLLDDFEERRAKLKLEENAYAGIQPIDDVNNEVLEATRVTRHKNMRALRWEAGNYTNENGQ
ncbi:mitotic interactor and substrate of PLK1 [Esox lucius]|uniref:mitotic interactor and substrate of PLK1 n=1 Tax=Esox lucius TaxID=8010 RepID=UPI0014771167|nr:mitotic interactor and substrate of PLK1 [Esox lucius]